MIKSMTMEEFFTACEEFDWYYDFSDDNRVYRRGQSRADWLQTEAQGDHVKEEIWADWGKHMFTGASWGNKREPKPELEDYRENNGSQQVSG